MSGRRLSVLIVARTSRRPAVKVVQNQEQGVLWMRALRMQTPAEVAGATRRRQPGFDKRCGNGVELGWVDPQGITGVVPANDNAAVTADARTQAIPGKGMPIGCWVREVGDDADRILPEGAPNMNSPPVSTIMSQAAK